MKEPAKARLLRALLKPGGGETSGRIRLKDGKEVRFEGGMSVLESLKDFVLVRTSDGPLSFPWSEIEDVDFDEPAP